MPPGCHPASGHGVGAALIVPPLHTAGWPARAHSRIFSFHLRRRESGETSEDSGRDAGGGEGDTDRDLETRGERQMNNSEMGTQTDHGERQSLAGMPRGRDHSLCGPPCGKCTCGPR